MRNGVGQSGARTGRARGARRLRLLALSVLSAATAGGALAAGEPPATPGAGDEASRAVTLMGRHQTAARPSSQPEEAIVEVYLRRTTQLSGGMMAYIEGDDMLVPLQELMVLLEFAIEETPGGAAGWFIAEDRRFLLDLKSGVVQSDGKKFQLASAEARRIDKQLYVSAKSLSTWLPLTFLADLRSQQLQVNPREITPAEERARRNKDKQYGSIYQYRSQLPKQETPYAAAQIPAIEADLFGGYGRSARAGRSNLSELYAGGTVRAFGDLAYMSGEGFATGNQRGVVDARLRLGRVDPDGGLVGPLNATQFWVGDVGAVAVPLVSAGLYGRGVNISSRPQAYLAEFDRVTIEDSVPLGHEVELYRNGILMDSSGPSQSGRFKFENVPLLRGANEIRLEFYGPQGQRRTEVKQYFVGASQVPVGKFNYDITVNEVGRSVFGFTNWVRDNRLYDNTALGGAARFDYGLLRNLSITGGFVAAPLPTRTREITGDDYRLYSTLGARTMLWDMSLGVDGAMDDKGGVAAGVSAQTAYEGWTLSGRHEQFMNRFASDTSLGTAYATREYAYRTSNTVLRADTYAGRLLMGQLNYNLGLVGNYTTFENVAPSWRVGTTVGASMGRFSVANDIYYGGAISNDNQGILGSVRANVRIWEGISLRGSADYDLRSIAEVKGFSGGLTVPLPDQVTLGLGYAQRYDAYRVQPNSQSYFASLRRRFGMAEVGFLASYNKYEQIDRYNQFDQRSFKDDYRAVVTVSFSTFTDPSSMSTLVSADRIARQGAIRPVAFHDLNQNGVRDPNEPTLEGVKVVHAGQREPYVTGGAASPPMGPVGVGGWTDVAIDRAGLPDQTLSPGNSGRAVLPRPGVVSTVDLPVVAKAGVEGRVELRLARERRPLPNVRVQIVRRAPAGEATVVKEVNTEYDGTFSLADVPVGEYVVRVEPEQARQIGAKAAAEQAIALTPQTGVLDGIALTLNRSSWSTDVCETSKTEGRC